jgi:3-hydroxybutyryl-CoA dehydratase
MSIARSRQPNEIVEGLTESASFFITASDMADFAKLSGDKNPLHTDPNFAQSKGFKGPVVYGGLLVSQISKMLGMTLPGENSMWIGLNISFRNPLYVDTPATLSAKVKHFSEATGIVTLNFKVETSTQVIATGYAESLLKDDND